ncbi:MAG: DUF2911 domain-containing protein [Thermoflavifilum sp.]|nr:DUF2911 domain-containing protein [Thermoflavifilum sp.]
MKKHFLPLLLIACCTWLVQTSYAQQTEVKFPPLDVSPMDMIYYPPNYPSAKLSGQAGELIMRVIYSRPQKKGRTIFGGLEPFGKVDRLGANEADELDVFSPVSIGGKTLQPGRYTFYAIFNPDHWTFIVNAETDTWGAFGYDPKKDIVRIDVPVQQVSQPIEALSMVFQKTSKGADLVIGWDTTLVRVPFEF